MMPSGALMLLRCRVLLSVLFMVATVLLPGLIIDSLRPMSSGRAAGAWCDGGGGRKSERRKAVVDALVVHWTRWVLSEKSVEQIYEEKRGKSAGARELGEQTTLTQATSAPTR